MDLNNVENQNQNDQIKELLNKYSDEVNQQNQSEIQSTESQPSTEIPVENKILPNLELESGSNITLGSGFESQIPNTNSNGQTSEILPPPIENQELPEQNFIPVKPKINFAKILFFISFFIFLIVLSFLVFAFLNKQKTQQNIIQNNEITPSPAIITGGFCNLNDKQYSIGETFPSADGCNTCSCNQDLYIVCTEKACEELSTVPTLVPTATVATKAATATSSSKKITVTPVASKSAKLIQ